MLRAFSVVTFVALASAQHQGPVQWGLQFEGECEFTNHEQTQVYCEGKALSAEYSAFIDDQTGVDWQISEEKVGPAAYLEYTEEWSAPPHDGGEMKFGDGTMHFRNSGSNEIPTTLEFFYKGEDFEIHQDPNNNKHMLAAGYLNITGGTGVYAMSDGWASFNRKDHFDSAEHDVEFVNFVFCNFVEPPPEE